MKILLILWALAPTLIFAQNTNLEVTDNNLALATSQSNDESIKALNACSSAKDDKVIHPKYGFDNGKALVTFQAVRENTVTFKVAISSKICTMPTLEGTAVYNSKTQLWEGISYTHYKGNNSSEHGVIRFEPLESGKKLKVHGYDLKNLGTKCDMPCGFTPCNVLD